MARRGGFDTMPYPELSRLEERLSVLPAYARMQAVDARSRAELGL